ncbi:hypothetical protein LIER_21336 [Lithospermum erythrorhizon]|uniref:Uncharacterized protein n=1 Tax=Lithospermum erythrorhizon TaxID=34254 RepID=A0AAV3QPX0_LITER
MDLNSMLRYYGICVSALGLNIDSPRCATLRQMVRRNPFQSRVWNEVHMRECLDFTDELRDRALYRMQSKSKKHDKLNPKREGPYKKYYV